MSNIEDMVGVETIMQATMDEFFCGDPVKYVLHLSAWIYRDPELKRSYTKDDNRNDYYDLRADPNGNYAPIGISFIAGMDKYPNTEKLLMQFHRYNCFLPHAPPVHVIQGENGPNILSEKEQVIVDGIKIKEQFNTEPLEEKLKRYAKCWTGTRKAHDKQDTSVEDRYRLRVENATFENLFINTYRQLWIIFHQEGRGDELPAPQSFFSSKEESIITPMESKAGEFAVN